MRFQEVKEAVIPKEEHILKAYHSIYQNCQHYLQQVDNRPDRYPLWRGMKYMGHGNVYNAEDIDVGKKQVRLTNRKPLDTPQEDHDALNSFMQREYEHPFRNGLFATGADHVAAGYGDTDEPYAIFPIGKFDILWHRDIGDTWNDFFDSPAYYEYKHVEKIPLDELVYKMFEEYYGPYEEGDLQEAIDSGMEIMIWVKEYYYMRAEFLPGFEAWLNK